MDFKRIVWIEYYYLTELYDSRLPLATIMEKVFIVHPSYYKYSSQFSLKLLRIMRDRLGIYGRCSSKDLDKYSLEELSDMYEQLPEKPLTRLLEEDQRGNKRSSELWHGNRE